MKRIIIIGCGGAGKSTLSKELAKKLDLPLYHLDKIFWKPGWVEPPRSEFIAEQEKIIAEEKWIIDGNYISTIPLRAERADTIIYVNPPIRVCLYGALKRNFSKAERTDMAEGCVENFDMKFLSWIVTFRKHTAPKIEKILEENKSSKKIIELRSREEVNKFCTDI